MTCATVNHFIFTQGCWTLNIFATNATELYISNIIAGLVGGGSLALMPLLIAEISVDE